jgi:hypothetical protein
MSTSSCRRPSAARPNLLLQLVAEPKLAKKRCHIDPALPT